MKNCLPVDGAPTLEAGGRMEGRMTMKDRDLRRFEIMDRYGVDEDTAEIMLLEEEEEEERERKNKGIIY